MVDILDISAFFFDLKEEKIPDDNYLTNLPLLVYILSAIFCLGSSGFFHTFQPISEKAFRFYQRLDMAGISVLIFGSAYCSNQYFFHCNPPLRSFYCWLSFIICFAVFVRTLSPKMHSHKNQASKGLMFGALGLINGFQIFHWIYITYINEPFAIYNPYIFSGIVLMGFLYLFGLSFYINKFPEKHFPKKFDICCSSHSIFHVFVFTSALSYYYTLSYLYYARQ